MTDGNENTRMLEQFSHILKKLSKHAKERNCKHRVRQLLDEMEFDVE
jgi:hypothetical protein